MIGVFCFYDEDAADEDKQFRLASLSGKIFLFDNENTANDWRIAVLVDANEIQYDAGTGIYSIAFDDGKQDYYSREDVLAAWEDSCLAQQFFHIYDVEDKRRNVIWTRGGI